MRRLAGFGFRTEFQGSVVSYLLEQEGCAVFADPRASGRIDFVVSPEGRRNRTADYQTFYLLDAWTKDVHGMFARRLAGAVGALAARAPPAPRSG